jgi:GUN4-like
LTCLRLLTGCFPDDQGIDPLFDEQQQEWHWGSHIHTRSDTLSQVFKSLLQTDVAERYVSAQVALEDLADAAEICWVSDASIASEHGFESVDVDYAHLQSLLAAQAYEAADAETWRLLLALTCRTAQNNLTLDALELLSRSALQIIDRLWWTHSQGRFGLRVQHQLYRELGGTTEFDFVRWEQFAEQVGWCCDHHWLNYRELTFSNRAPMGHLPTCCMDSLNRQGEERGVCGWWRLGFVTLMERLESSG